MYYNVLNYLYYPPSLPSIQDSATSAGQAILVEELTVKVKDSDERMAAYEQDAVILKEKVGGLIKYRLINY